MSQNEKLYEYVGVVHIHTLDSDGTKPHEYIIKLAQKYNIDFLMFADHMTLASRSKEGWYDGVLVIIGYEHEDPTGINHYLVFGMNEVLPRTLTPKEYVARVREAGGIGIIAHPFESRRMQKYPPYPWTEWDAYQFDGIEIWNHMSSWLEGIACGNKLKYLLKPRSLLHAPPALAIKKWDELNLSRKVCGIVSADAHGYKLRLLKLFWRTIFPYKISLNSLWTHILARKPIPENFERAKDFVFDTIRECRVFISNRRWGDARGFRFFAKSGGEFASIGDRIYLSPELRFFVVAPDSSDIIFVRNGEKIEKKHGKTAEFKPFEEGIYRVELLREGKVWIISNHIRVISGTK